MMKRRAFLQFTASALAPLVVKPLPMFVPPRAPYVEHREGLGGLYSHLGVLPPTPQLSISEGLILEIGDWDGVGYPCLIENACTFGRDRPRVWIHDFDLWNFRHDDEFWPLRKRPDYAGMPNTACCHALRRFGDDLLEIAKQGGGPMHRWLTAGRER